MKVREISAPDLSAIADLRGRELVLDRDAAAIPGILMRRPHVGLVATGESGLLGACVGSAGEAGEASPDGYIDLLVADRAERRCGIGRRLVADMEQELAARG